MKAAIITIIALAAVAVFAYSLLIVGTIRDQMPPR